MKICKTAGCDKPATRKGRCNSCSRKQYYAEHQESEKAYARQQTRTKKELRDAVLASQKIKHPEEFQPKPCVTKGCGRRLATTKTRTGLCTRCLHRRWINAHPTKFPDYKARWYASNVERESVRGHHYFIYRQLRPAYAGMPFWDAWNPDKGGSFNVGGQWIIEHLGHRPGKLYELHVIDRRIGFVPGNLVWVPQNKHQQEELINRLLLENQNLRIENTTLKAAQ